MSSVNSLTVEDLGSAAQRDRRKRILDATIALASKGGFDAVQMRAVAEQADVALGTLYRYFPSKIHLLVSALGREFERAEAISREKPIPGDTAHERVMYVLNRTTRGLQGDPHLTEALTRAFMFADASVANEIHVVGMLLTSMLTRAMHPEKDRAHRRRRRDRRASSATSGSPRWSAGSPAAPPRATSSSGWTSPSACCCAEPAATDPTVTGPAAHQPPNAWVAVTPPSIAISAPLT